MLLAQSLLEYVDLSSLTTGFESAANSIAEFVRDHPSAMYIVGAVMLILFFRALAGRR